MYRFPLLLVYIIVTTQTQFMQQPTELYIAALTGDAMASSDMDTRDPDFQRSDPWRIVGTFSAPTLANRWDFQRSDLGES